MNFKQVEAFRAVMSTRSMTTAASLLHTSQPNVSRSIRLLEVEVGFVLFQRAGTRLIPTAEAEIFSRDVDRVFLGLLALSESASSIRARGTGVLRVGASGSISTCVLPEALARFRKIYPDVPVVVNTGKTDVVANWTATGVCDIGFCSYKIDIANLVYDHVNTSFGVCVVHKSHKLSKRRNLKPSDFAGEDFISLTAGGLNRQAIDRRFSKVQRVLSLETPYAPTICMMVSKGLGSSIMNPVVVRSQPHRNVLEIPFSEKIPFDTYAVTSESLKVGVLTQAFRSCVGEAFRAILHPA